MTTQHLLASDNTTQLTQMVVMSTRVLLLTPCTTPNRTPGESGLPCLLSSTLIGVVNSRKLTTGTRGRSLQSDDDEDEEDYYV